MPFFSLLELVQLELSRELDQTELELLENLSPAGIAKVNYDICRGIPVSVTLDQLQVAYAKLRHRWKTLYETLQADMKLFITQVLPRLPTLDELHLLHSATVHVLDELLEERRKQGDSIEHVLEELAVDFKYIQLVSEGTELAKGQNLPVRYGRLAPTTAEGIIESRNEEGFVITTKVTSQRVYAGFCPLAVWFEQKHQKSEPTMVGCMTPSNKKFSLSRCSSSCSSLSSLPGAVDSPPSILKHSHSSTSSLSPSHRGVTFSEVTTCQTLREFYLSTADSMEYMANLDHKELPAKCSGMTQAEREANTVLTFLERDYRAMTTLGDPTRLPSPSYKKRKHGKVVKGGGPSASATTALTTPT